MWSFFSRFFATLFRAWSAALCLGTVALCVGLLDVAPWTALVGSWVEGASAALWLGVMVIALMGVVRLLFRAQPGDARDPLRKLAAGLAPYREPVTAGLVALALGSGVASVFLPPGLAAHAARTAACGLVFLASRARHLHWFAGLRQAADGRVGRVRFVAGRVFGDFGTLFGGLLCLIGGLALLGVLKGAAIPITLFLVLGWFTWALPRRYVTVGKDGIDVAGWRDRFFAFDGSMLAEVHHDAMAVFPRGRPRPLHLHYGPMSAEDRQELVSRLQIRVGTARDAAASPGFAPTDLAATLASLDGGTGYRIAEVPRETLWRIVEAPLVETRVRLRAAELVAADPYEDDLPRLRRVADELAEPDTAEALARIARRPVA